MPAPRLARWLLRRARPESRLGDWEADLDALYERRRADGGAWYAWRRYWQDAISLCLPPAAEREPSRRVSIVAGHVWHEMRQVARSARRQPGFFAVAAITLGIGVTAHLSAFSIVDRLLLAWPPHVVDAHRVFRLHIDRSQSDGTRFLWFQTPHRSVTDLRAGLAAVGDLASYRTSQTSIGVGAEARRATVVFADGAYFGLLGVTPQLGRLFADAEDRAPAGAPVVVLSDTFWRARFGADPSVLGQDLRIGARDYTVIGVAPAGFSGDEFSPVDAWAPFHAGAYELPASWAESLTFRSATALVRLRPGVTRQAAENAGAVRYRQAVDGTAAADPQARIVLSSLSAGRTQRGELTPAGRIALWVEATALMVLLVALANVINLMTARAVRQRRDVGLRVALGAGRSRLLLRAALELALVVVAALAVAVVLTTAAAPLVQPLLQPGVPAAPWGGALPSVAAATGGVLWCVLLAFGAAFTLPGMRERVDSSRTVAGGSHAPVRQALVVAQVVMSTMLLIGASLFLQSVMQLSRLDFGHDQDRVLVVTTALRGAGYSDEAAEGFYRRALDVLPSVPGLGPAAAAQSTPFAPSQGTAFIVPGFDRLPFAGVPTFYTISPQYFDTMGMRILRGRGFRDADTASAPPVVVVEQALAEALWPNEDPLTKCVRLTTAEAPCRQVVGVSTNTRRFVGVATGSLRYYVPLGQRLAVQPPQALFVRTDGDPQLAIPTVRESLFGLDDRLPHLQVRVLRDLTEPETRPWRMGRTLFLLLAVSALFVATAGVYAMLSMLVADRTRELAVRMALGATSGATRWLVLKQCLVWIIAGLAIGSLAALGLGRYLEPLLFETSAWDPRAYGGAAGLLLVIASVAALIPAARASRIDPNVAFRSE